MKESVLLLVTGAGISLAAWAFWHYLGNDASCTLLTIVLIGVVADNARLRRQLRGRRGG
jgi:hypothetical protein